MEKTDSKLCLIVEDEALHRKIIHEVLEPFDFKIIEADDGKKAITKCEEKMPDVIVLDWMMPNLDGPSFVEKLRSMKNGEKPYVIMCTAKARKGNMAEAVSAGVDNYITKPFDPELIETMLLEANVISHQEF